MTDGKKIDIPAGDYNVSGTMKVYTHVTVSEDGEISVQKDTMDIGSHRLDDPADVWNSEDQSVSQEIAEALVEHLNSDPSAWDSTDGMRWA
jgi:hypothetical protein